MARQIDNLRARLEADLAGRSATPRGNVIEASDYQRVRPFAEALDRLFMAKRWGTAGDERTPAPSAILPPLV